jgi:hypothetical protein
MQYYCNSRRKYVKLELHPFRYNLYHIRPHYTLTGIFIYYVAFRSRRTEQESKTETDSLRIHYESKIAYYFMQ